MTGYQVTTASQLSTRKLKRVYIRHLRRLWYWDKRLANESRYSSLFKYTQQKYVWYSESVGQLRAELKHRGHHA